MLRRGAARLRALPVARSGRPDGGTDPRAPARPAPRSRAAAVIRVVAAVAVRAGTVLVCQRSAPRTHAGQWEFPGGKIEAGETRRAGSRCTAKRLQRYLRKVQTLTLSLPPLTGCSALGEIGERVLIDDRASVTRRPIGKRVDGEKMRDLLRPFEQPVHEDDEPGV